PTHMLFFSLRYGHRRDLHSFPTRRSSDLGLPSCRPMRETQVSGKPDGANGTGRPVPRPLSRPSPTANLAGSWKAIFLGARAFSRDRKSTRLNSSHRTISYAVFCLKKKKKY